MMCVQVCCSKGQIKIVASSSSSSSGFSSFRPTHLLIVVVSSIYLMIVSPLLSSLIYEVYLCPYHCIYFRIFMLFSVQLTFHIIFY
jgi:hypothetical protein